MYIVTNLDMHTETECDAIEKIIYDSEKEIYVSSDNPDGFKALVIEHISPTEEHYIETVYAFEGHTLSGDEPIGEYRWEDDEPEEAEGR